MVKNILWSIFAVVWIVVLANLCNHAGRPVPIENATLEKTEYLQHVKMYHNVTYSKLPMSQMDILLPKKIKKGDKLPLILWTHGGGFIAGDKKHKNPYLAQIAEQGFIVANMNYALAPSSKYPTPVLQQVAASEFLMKNKLKLPIDTQQIIIGGDSAGAQLASQFAALQTNPKLQRAMKLKPSFKRSQIKGVILFGGLYDMKTVRSTHFPRIELFLSSYTGEKNWERDFVPINQLSVTKQMTPDYPPTFLTVGDADPFYSQAIELTNVLQKNKVPYQTSFFKKGTGLKHQYQFHMELKPSRVTYKKVMTFLGQYTNQSPYEANTAKK